MLNFYGRHFRYCPGNVIDVSTLIRTMKELEQCGVDTKFAILDAGYYDNENIKELYENGVSFITRLKENRKIYKRNPGRFHPRFVAADRTG